MRLSFYENALSNVKASEIAELASHSIINHHAEGLNYLCLKRSVQETVKIYYMPKPKNDNSGYLVNPHNHRYEFFSTVLHGSLHHLRFKESPSHGQKFLKHKYSWETKEVKPINETFLYPHKDDFCDIGSTYHVKTEEIHTLKILEPTIIGLTQFQDSNEESFLYLPTGKNVFKKSSPFAPTPREYMILLFEVMHILGVTK